MSNCKSERKNLSFSLDEDLNAIKLKFRNQKYIIIVEGEEDKSFYYHYLGMNKKDFLIYATKFCEYSKGRAIEIARKKPELTRTCTIVDADLDRILGTEPQDDNIVITDHHDLEMCILMSPALDKVINLKVKKELLNNLLTSFQDFRDFILTNSVILAQIRHLNIVNDWKICFKKLHRRRKDSSKFFLSGRFNSEHDCIYDVLTLKKDSQVTYDEIKTALINYGQICGSPDLSQLCHGKDTMQIAVYYINTHLRGKRKDLINSSHIWLAYEEEYIKNSSLYKKYHLWLKRK